MSYAADHLGVKPALCATCKHHWSRHAMTGTGACNYRCDKSCTKFVPMNPKENTNA